MRRFLIYTKFQLQWPINQKNGSYYIIVDEEDNNIVNLFPRNSKVS